MPNSVKEKALYGTFRLTSRNILSGEMQFGTGFILNFKSDGEGTADVLITTRSMIEGAEDLQIHLHEAKHTNMIKHPTGNIIDFCLDGLKEAWFYHPNLEVDLCCLPFVIINCELSDRGQKIITESIEITSVVTDEKLNEELSPINDAYVYGFPNGVTDEKNYFPLILHGKTASHPGLDLNGKPLGALNMTFLPGIVGSPVMLHKGSSVFETDKVMQPILLGVVFGGAVMNLKNEIETKSISTHSMYLPTLGEFPIPICFYMKAKELITLRDYCWNCLGI